MKRKRQNVPFNAERFVAILRVRDRSLYPFVRGAFPLFPYSPFFSITSDQLQLVVQSFREWRDIEGCKVEFSRAAYGISWVLELINTAPQTREMRGGMV